MNDIKIGCGVKGMYKIQVLENGRVVEDRPWAKNMILNQGLDYALSGSFYQVPTLFRYHCVGTGTNAVSATDTGLQSESKRTSTLLIGSGNVGTTTTSDTATFRYTWDHSIEGVGGANYTEHGISPYSSAGNNLFARSLISGGTVSVAEGQQLRVIYDVSVTVTPSVQTATTGGGTGWPVAGVTDCTGNCIIVNWDVAVGLLSTDGFPYTSSFLSFSGNYGMGACSSLSLNTAIGSGSSHSEITNSRITMNAGTYIPGAFTRNYAPTEYASASSWASTNVVGWMFKAQSNTAPVFAFKYNYAQTKANTHRLRYPSITITWARA